MKPRWLDLDLAFSMLLGVTVAIGVWQALDWRFGAKLFPLVVGTVALGLVVLRIVGRVVGAIRGNEPPPQEEILDLPVDDSVPPKEFLRRSGVAAAWVFGFLVGAMLMGLAPATPVFLLAYLRLQARLPWWHAALVAAVALLLMTVVFGQVLGIQLPAGLLWGPDRPTL